MIPPVRSRSLILLASLLISFAFIAIGSFVFSFLLPGHILGDVFFDLSSTLFPYPLTVQNVMYVVFFLGMGDVYARWKTAERERAFTLAQLLPEDDDTLLEVSDMPDVRQRVMNRFDDENGFLPALTERCALQFLQTRSPEQATTVLTSTTALFEHRVDLRYTHLRYLVWVLPTFGFIGTVIGIANALATLDANSPDLGQMTRSLGMAFHTTLVALILSAILVWFMGMAQQREESALNRSADYVLRNLIGRLVQPGA